MFIEIVYARVNRVPEERHILRLYAVPPELMCMDGIIFYKHAAPPELKRLRFPDAVVWLNIFYDIKQLLSIFVQNIRLLCLLR